MKFKLNDIVKIVAPVIRSDSVSEAAELIGQTAKIIQICENQLVIRGVYPYYENACIDGYKLSIGSSEWTWTDDELELVKSENEDMNENSGFVAGDDFRINNDGTMWANNAEIQSILDVVDKDGFFLSYKVCDRINTMSFPYDATIDEVGNALVQFLAGCGFSESTINKIIDIDELA